MQVSVETTEGLERRMTIRLPNEQIESKVESQLKRMARDVRMDGFRPGKVPMRVIRQRYGAGARQEVLGEVIESAYRDAIVQEALRPAGYPNIEPVEGEENSEEFVFCAVFEVFPEVAVASMEGGEITRPVAEVTDADVDNMLNTLKKQRATWAEVEREAADNDQVSINFAGKIDGEAFEGGSAEGYELVLGSKSMIEGFEAGIVGAKTGESRSLNLQFPEDYGVGDLAGKAVEFEVEVLKVSEQVMPEVTAEFIQSFGVESGEEADLRAEVRDNMQRELDGLLKGKVKEQVMDLLVGKHEFDVPKALVESEIDALIEQSRQGLPEQLRNAGGVDIPRDLFKEQADRRVRLGLILQSVVQSNDIKVDEERLKAYVEEQAQGYDNPQEVVDYYLKNPQNRSTVESLVMEEQVVEWVMGQVTIADEQSSFDALTGRGQG